VLVRKAFPSDFEKIRQFYADRLPGYVVSPNDSIYIALVGDSICGVVRLVEEQGLLLLRGMQVSPLHQKVGNGTKLLEILDREIGARECFCIPYAYLEKFYGKIGFRRTDEDKAPQLLRKRLQKYRLESDSVIMVRPAKTY
jgi:N-acetylglutamate synthase-like GNAT family acetyltransferase